MAMEDKMSDVLRQISLAGGAAGAWPGTARGYRDSSGLEAWRGRARSDGE